MELDSSNSGVKQRSSLYKLGLFVEHGILRVGGRIVRSVIPCVGKYHILVFEINCVVHWHHFVFVFKAKLLRVG